MCLWRIPGWLMAPQTFPPVIVAGLVLVGVNVGVYLSSLLISKTHQTLYDLLAGISVLKRGEKPAKPAHSRMRAQKCNHACLERQTRPF